MRSLSLAILLILMSVFLAAPGRARPAAPPVGSSANQPAANSLDALAGGVRDYLVHNLPPVLYEKSRGWGHTKPVAKGLKWTGKGLQSQVHTEYAERNDGIWHKLRLAAPNLANSLSLTFQNVRQAEPGKTTFDVAIAFDARVDYEQQNWKSGVRLYSASARARLRIKLALACEATSHIDWQKGVLPEAVFRLRVAKANASYDNFVLEHVAGVGGDAAKLIGEAAPDYVHKWRPSIERKLLERANAAIEKAGETKEIRLGLGKLMNCKGLLEKTANPPPALPKQ